MVGRNVREAPQADAHEIVAPTSTELNLLNGSSVRAFLDATQPDVVVHAAGVVGGIQANIDSPVRFFTANTTMAVNLIEGSRDVGVPKLLNIGSSCMYPREAENPLREESILTGALEPTNEGYALAKIGAARLCDYVSREDPTLGYKTIIPCNLYGPFDKFGPNAHMIPAAIAKVHDAITTGASHVSIWGPGSARREFMYAGDLAHFIFFALDHFSQLPGVLNVGVGSDLTINEYYARVAEVLGFTGGFEHDLSKPVGMDQKLVDITRQSALGWAPQTPLEQGLLHTYDYYRGTQS